MQLQHFTLSPKFTAPRAAPTRDSITLSELYLYLTNSPVAGSSPKARWRGFKTPPFHLGTKGGFLKKDCFRESVKAVA